MKNRSGFEKAVGMPAVGMTGAVGAVLAVAGAEVTIVGTAVTAASVIDDRLNPSKVKRSMKTRW